MPIVFQGENKFLLDEEATIGLMGMMIWGQTLTIAPDNSIPSLFNEARVTALQEGWKVDVFEGFLCVEDDHSAIFPTPMKAIAAIKEYWENQ